MRSRSGGAFQPGFVCLLPLSSDIPSGSRTGGVRGDAPHLISGSGRLSRCMMKVSRSCDQIPQRRGGNAEPVSFFLFLPSALSKMRTGSSLSINEENALSDVDRRRLPRYASGVNSCRAILTPPSFSSGACWSEGACNCLQLGNGPSLSRSPDALRPSVSPPRSGGRCC